MSHIKYFMMPLMPLLLLAQPAGARFTNDVEVGHPRHSRPYYVERFEGWMSKHGIDFDTKEDYEHRLNVFIKNSDKIEEHNTESNDATYTLAHNEFSHLTWEEFRTSHMGFNPRQRPDQQPKIEVEVDASVSRRRRTVFIPDEIDWVAAGAVAPVQNQGMCGSCWAFSAIGAMEGAYYLETGQLVKLSEEQLVDCDTTDMGCNGGEMTQAFDWIKQNKGVCDEEEYPYEGIWSIFNTCHETCSIVEGTQVKEWKQVDATDEALMTALAEVGPIAIAIEADQNSFQFYSSGVFTAACGSNLDHGVLAVGYGTSDDGVDYWKVKNSWGASWGMDGYILLERSDSEEDQGGECGLLIDAVYPILGNPELPTIVREPGFESTAIAKDCGNGATEIIFDSVVVHPSSPSRGKPVSMEATGTLTQPMTSGTYALSVSLGSSSVYQHNGPMCGESTTELPLGLGTIEIHGLDCPAAPGPVSLSLDLVMPPIAPPGDYDISLSATDDNASSLLCVDVELKL